MSELRCRRCGRTAAVMESIPLRGPLAEKVRTSACAACWAEWVEAQTKMINELRLSLRHAEHRAKLSEEMLSFLGLRDDAPRQE